MSNRLPETDLANMAFLSATMKREAIERFLRPKQIKGTYEPFRQFFPDIVNRQVPMFEDLASTPWEVIESSIRRACRTKPDSLLMNLEIAQATHEYIIRERVNALAIDVTPLSFGTGHVYYFGLSVLMRYPNRIAAVFLDMRRTGNLSQTGRDFIFSTLHERYRTAYPDLANIDLEIFRYKNNKNRTLVAIQPSNVIYSLDQITTDVRETYAIYDMVLKGDTEKRRRSGGGSIGPLFG